MNPELPLKPLGMIAGSGNLPKLIIETCQKKQRPIFLLAYHGYTDPKLTENVDHEWCHLGEIGYAVQALQKRGIKEIVLAGTGLTQRPSLRQIIPDKEGMKLLARIGWKWAGDNKVISIIHEFIHEKGFEVVSPQAIIPTLIALEGALGKYTPPLECQSDIQKGKEALAHLSLLDCGQGLAIQQGLILGIEAAEGTNACIQRCALLQRPGESPAIYIKRAKIDQNENIDLPVIGPQSIEALIESGFQGLSFQAHKTLILFHEEVKALADDAGIFLWGEI